MKSTHSPLANVNLKLLQAFLLVGEHSSFRAAAEMSYRSTSAVSAQIRQLEDQLGVPLFHRTTRNVRLTAEGQQLLECARRALLEVETGLRKIQEAADVQRGRVAISCSPTIAATRLARVLAAYEKDYPGVEVYVREQPSVQLFETIRKREADFGIGPVVETGEFQFETVLEDPLYALVPKRFITTSNDTIALATLTNMPLLVLNPANALREALEATMRERNLTITTRYEFTQAATLISMASAGLGAAILQKVVLPPVIDKNTYALRIVSPAMSREVAIITARGQSLSPASRRLAELLKQGLPDPGEHPRPTRRKSRVGLALDS
ncbi:LysR family transcriptional regulator [Piscinibacter sakaiensis]|uniref:LysR family transcriptional regulator n=1 Tax=Piscinibacter sakaiensis TaxID=1547922 RepID=UPI003AAB675D